MNAFFTVCQIFYWTGIFPKALEFPTVSISNNNIDFSNVKLDTDLIMCPTEASKKELSQLEKENIANGYGFSTGYNKDILEKYIIYDEDKGNNFISNNFITF